MEEDIIKHFEELKRNKEHIANIDTDFFFDFVENLINRNKTLEKHIAFYEKNESYKARIIELKEDLQMQEDYTKDLQKKLTNSVEIKYIHQDYIPKSKVREKIEEYKWASEGYDSDVADYGQSQAIGAYIALIKLLQEGDTNETKM